MVPRKQQESIDTRTGPNWPAFYRLLAIGHFRRIGLLPVPKEVQERLARERAAKNGPAKAG